MALGHRNLGPGLLAILLSLGAAGVAGASSVTSNGGYIATGGTSQVIASSTACGSCSLRVVVNPSTALEQGIGTVGAVTIVAPGTGYVPEMTITLSTAGSRQSASGAPTATLVLTDTQVVSIVSVVSTGAGCTNGTGLVFAGTTGVGTYFQAQYNVVGNSLSGTGTIVYSGDYTTNPTTLTAEPLSGNGCTTLPQLSLTMGALKARVSNAGLYSRLPTSPAAGTPAMGATWNLTPGGVPENLYITLAGSAATTYGQSNFAVLTPGGSAALSFNGQVWTGEIDGTAATTYHQYYETDISP